MSPRARRSWLPFLLAASLTAPSAADGTGMIGWGKTMYDPPCAFACRNVLRNCRLLCTPPAGRGRNYGSAHSPNWTPPECFTTDAAFLRTMALCIDTYCQPSAEKPSAASLDDYWASHLGVPTVGDYTWVPAVSYAEALRAARADEREAAAAGARGGNSSNSAAGSGGGGGSHARLKARQHGHSEPTSGAGGNATVLGSALPRIKARQPLNVTSFVAHEDWLKPYNGAKLFETNEVGHSNSTIGVLLVALLTPVLLSLLRFIPGLARSRTWTWINCMANHPAALGRRHREPRGGAWALGGATVPTRGQLLYIGLISFINITCVLAPYYYAFPNSTYPTRRNQDMATMGNRAGSMAMGNAGALFVFSARNSALLWLTDWHHATFLLLHRWLGYWAVALTVAHSALLLATYVEYGDYAMELARLYWQWGIVGTVAAVALLPASAPALRRAAYEVFLPLHHVLAVLFLVGYYYHIWHLYEYNWGYEIWVWFAVGVWGADKLARLARTARNGLRTVVVSAVEGSGGQYLRIEVDGVRVEGVVYLRFPTLSWMFWENHPFSVVSSFVDADGQAEEVEVQGEGSGGGVTVVGEKSASDNVVAEEARDPSPLGSSVARHHPRTATATTATAPRATFIVRTRNGVTAHLAARLAASSSSPDTQAPLRLPVLVEGSYRYASSGPARVRGCEALLCVAGGVGVTALLPLLREFSSSSAAAPAKGDDDDGSPPTTTTITTTARLVWGVRDGSLPAALAGQLAGLGAGGVAVETSVGARVDVRAVVRDEMAAGRGPLGVVVCGPPGMADDVRAAVAELGRSGRRAVVFVDETFGW
ncbi:hypothetical protein RB597_007747 [Gaeumannomyces tritici]